MRALLAVLIALVAVAVPCRAEDTLPARTLQDLKSATVYIKVRCAHGEATGSGFVVGTDGTEVIVVTNEHVINPKDDGSQPRPRRPRGPFGPFGPPGFPGPRMADGFGEVLSCEVVFNSGRKGEKTARAEVIASEAAADLAVVRVTGVKDPPRPLDLSQKVEPVETMAVWTFGFPFGESLSPDKQSNPAVTVGRASVSSIRENARGELARVQFEGEVNPGNSGGPVVDAQGRLVGVAAAKVRDTRIGLAVPAVEVARMLDGRPARVSVFARAGDGKAPQVKAVVHLVDPLGRVRKVALRFLRADGLKQPHEPARDGTWPPLPDAEVAELAVTKSRAEGFLKLDLAGKRERLRVQAVLTLADGSERFGPSSEVRVGLDGTAVPPVVPKTEAGALTPKGDPDKPFDVGGLRVTPLRLDGRCWACWSADGKSVYVLEEKGVLRRLGVPELGEQARRDLGKRCAGLALSAEGLVVAAAAEDLVRLLDPATLETKKEVPVPGPTRVASAARLAVAFAVDRQKNLSLVDLKKGDVVRRYERSDAVWKDVRFDRCGVSPDGAYLFCTQTWGELARYRIDADGIKPDGKTPKVAFGPAEQFCFSPDGRYVCLPTAAGNHKLDGFPEIPGGGTYVFETSDLARPVFGVPNTPQGLAVAFDARGGAVYSHNSQNQLIVYDGRGVKNKAYHFGSGGVTQMLPHPEAGSLLIVAPGRLWYVEVP